jgi:hypothetical protein
MLHNLIPLLLNTTLQQQTADQDSLKIQQSISVGV